MARLCRSARQAPIGPRRDQADAHSHAIESFFPDRETHVRHCKSLRPGDGGNLAKCDNEFSRVGKKRFLSQWKWASAWSPAAGLWRACLADRQSRAMEVLLGSTTSEASWLRLMGYVTGRCRTPSSTDRRCARDPHLIIRQVGDFKHEAPLEPASLRRKSRWPPWEPVWPRRQGRQRRPGSRPSASWGGISQETRKKIVWDLPGRLNRKHSRGMSPHGDRAAKMMMTRQRAAHCDVRCACGFSDQSH